MITIDEVKVSDIPAVSNVIKTTWRDTYHEYLSPETSMKVTEFWLDPDILAHQITDPDVIFLAAKDETGTIVGVATALHIEPTTLQLAHLFVLPKKQRQGIGTLLLERVVKKLDYIKTIRTEVEDSNLRGLSFCIKRGFKKKGTKQDIVADTILLAIIMEKQL
ncbi:MAG: GNAT family N-acetyltransferase [bacterium]|nr:GNAT family N-acetyltransferase [bacterium]MDD5756716.1 GNAT family N-acetyltransferase [bacterium]